MEALQAFGIRRSVLVLFLRVEDDGKERWPGIDINGKVEYESNGAMVYTSIFF